jgi:hypothetical protein
MDKNLMKAIANVQAEAPVIKVDAKNPMYQGKKYATIKQIMDTIKPLLMKNNLVFSSHFDFRNEQWGMLSTLSWVGEYVATAEAFFPMERVADPQQLGKLATYARRYNLTSLLNLCFEDDEDDDDGNSFVGKKTAKVAPKPLNL